MLQDYINAVKEAGLRVADITAEVERTRQRWSLAPVVGALVALQGVDRLAAIILLAELGDISRFNFPRQLASFLDLAPSEHNSGARRRQGGTTQTENSHARRMLVECAWSSRFPARQARPCILSERPEMLRRKQRRFLAEAEETLRLLPQADAFRQENTRQTTVAMLPVLKQSVQKLLSDSLRRQPSSYASSPLSGFEAPPIVVHHFGNSATLPPLTVTS